jgi:YHS domain-containing protein
VPESPTIRCSEWNGEVRWFCSDGCQWIFDHEPERYSKAVGLDRVLTGKDVPEIRAHMRLSGKLGGVLEEC